MKLNKKYRIGDKVIIEHTSLMKEEIYFGVGFIGEMFRYCGKTAAITHVSDNSYKINIDNGYWNWQDWMFRDDIKKERKVKLEKLNNMNLNIS